MEKEKKLKGGQKLALERIYRLFELAEKSSEDKYTKRYLTLAKRISEKCRVSIPKELKKKYCRKCFLMNVTLTKKDPFLIVTCNNCKHEKKYALENKK
jgi:ribonuclease P protein subunit RPR2